jgi:protein involved in polysaccharide export with SLBB domain
MSNTTRALPPGIYGSLNSANSTLQLSKGDYVFSSMSMSRTEVQIVGPGPVRVFFTGAVNASGQTTFNMAGGKPSDLQFITDTGSAVSLSGHAAGYFLLYAPESTLSITGQSEIYGATVLRGINISGGAEIHFDKNLRVEFSGASGQRVIFRGE